MSESVAKRICKALAKKGYRLHEDRIDPEDNMAKSWFVYWSDAINVIAKHTDPLEARVKVAEQQRLLHAQRTGIHKIKIKGLEQASTALTEALKEYADPENWGNYYCDTTREYKSVFEPDGYQLAYEALEEAKEEK